MATWEDGPEYAPLERPSGFDQPAVAALDLPDAVPTPADVPPVERPAFDGPDRPVAELSTLVPAVSETRDPAVAFETVSTTMTSPSAWGSAHGSRPAGSGFPSAPAFLAGTSPQPVTAPALPTGAPSPTGWPASGPVATRDPWTPSGPSAPPPFPSPGSPEWFGPGPYGEPPPAPDKLSAKRVLEAATPGVWITLLVGGLVSPLAPVLLIVASVLASRIQVARRTVRTVFRVAVAGLLFFGLIGILQAVIDYTGFSEWWSFVSRWAQVFCWGLLVVVLSLVARSLGRADQPAPPRSPWG